MQNTISLKLEQHLKIMNLCKEYVCNPDEDELFNTMVENTTKTMVERTKSQPVNTYTLSPELQKLSAFGQKKYLLLTVIKLLQSSKRQQKYYATQARESIDEYQTVNSFITTKYTLNNSQNNITIDLLQKMRKLILSVATENSKLKKTLAVNIPKNKISFVPGSKWTLSTQMKNQVTKIKFEQYFEDEKKVKAMCEDINNLKETQQNMEYLSARSLQCTLLLQKNFIKRDEMYKPVTEYEIKNKQLVSMININNCTVNENNDDIYYTIHDINDTIKYLDEKDQMKRFLGMFKTEILKQYQMKKVMLRIRRLKMMKLFIRKFVGEYEKENATIIIPENVKMLIETKYCEMYHKYVFFWEVDKILLEEEFYEIFNDEQ